MVHQSPPLLGEGSKLQLLPDSAGAELDEPAVFSEPATLEGPVPAALLVEPEAPS